MGFNVSSTVKLDIPKLNKLTVTAVKALEITTALLLSEVKNAQVFPFKTGNLQNESTFADYDDSERGVARIVSDTVYARRLYYHPEYHFNHKYNAYARGKWYEPWLPGGSQEKFVAQAYASVYRKVSGI